MLSFEFDFPGEKLSVGFYTMRKRLHDLRPAFTVIAGVFAQDMTKQFRQEGRYPKWAEHQPLTKLIAKAEGKPLGRVLEGSRKLEKSFTTLGAKGHIRQIMRSMLRIGSGLTIPTKSGPVNLAALMSRKSEWTVTDKMRRFFLGRWGIPLNVGTTLKRKARQVMWVSPAAQKAMAARMHQHIMDEAGDAFKGFAYIRKG